MYRDRKFHDTQTLPTFNTSLTPNGFIDRVNQLAKDSIPFFFLVDFEKSFPVVMTLPEISQSKIQFDIPNQPGQVAATEKNPQDLSLNIAPVRLRTYSSSFERVKKHLLDGDSYLVNLTFPTRLHNNYTLEEIYDHAQAPYKLLYPTKFVTFSPESFIKIVDDQIFAYPMKGTIDANMPNAEESILNNQKEAWEHNTIVDLLRNDLSMVADRVEVTRFRYLDQIRTNNKDLLQVSSEIKGSLPRVWQHRLGNILWQLLPAGSISGAPKEKTLEIIKCSEISPRGFYTGVFGFFDGSNLDSAVNIRFIEEYEDGLRYRSGGGITASSQLHEEYQEMLDKIYVPTI
ncbi:MAG: aminodeoxychorismate synthase component I [Saprospiraceae bacterium]|nr:aminodeoxychorismate synthase component I [Saprospiraceae bacterium]